MPETCCTSAQGLMDAAPRGTDNVILADPVEALELASNETKSLRCQFPGCNKVFTRADSLKRHNLKHTGALRNFPCPHCVRYQDQGAFVRKDKLDQHMRQYHRIGCEKSESNPVYCYHEDCHNAIQHPNQGFSSNAELHKHMRKMHQWTPFQCPVEGCDRVNAKGWFRANDCRSHLLEVHARCNSPQTTE